MALKVLEENINKSMDCTIEFNGAAEFEVKKRLCQHKVDIAWRTCSCRLWQLRGIPCAYVVSALYFKKFSLYDYIDSCYSKETYLRIYANVIEPLTNMVIWPVSTNPTIVPPEITNMPSRPPKARRKEAGETKKSGKLPRTGLAMTCNICHVRGHNKRGCPQREGVESSTRQSAPSPTASVRAEPTGSGRGKGKPKPGMSSSKIYSTEQAKVTRLSYVTGDIGYTPSNTTKLKWNGKAAISTSKLHELREKQRKNTVGSSSSQNDTSSQSKMPWKL
ncbi:hypothetical protein MTR67_036831 [Solanum verrucosum]|uniref:SWIM-type domain-containing protein n=1 Tax=Solanum verrucosum TaxID=315347 RepID=A0AAF0UD35_SOLVR|nr:hypothetical protein MTR67_036831 [Solanum verrucosum]